MAGKVAKSGDMKVDTPAATLGIRGTTPHLEILGDGTFRFSTLIEEGKSKVTRKLRTATEQQPEPRSRSKSNLKSNLDTDQKANLKICRGARRSTGHALIPERKA
ncbi:hypothetical protein LJR220_001219 [Bradyrhizobium sp. LjRoot220]|uniref:hypothetical protein n=1 Tax=Bradyrhizobium sp. LjRoot220 TaxID=3342284 RepID=UPI003ECE155B